MNWKALTTEEELAELITNSYRQPQLIFKHSVRCSISGLVKDRLERNEQPTGMEFHFLDIFRFRNISNRVASEFGVRHESPQILIIRKGNCIYDESHLAIRMESISPYSEAA